MSMHWIIFALAIIIGGIIRSFYYESNNNIVLNIISFIVPFSLGVLFWIKLYGTGYNIIHYSTYVINVPDSNQDTSKWLMIILTSCGIAGLSWAFGAILHGGTNNKLKWTGITCAEIWPVQVFRTEAINTSGSCDELQVIPCSISSTPAYNTYQPTVLEGADKKRVIRRMNQYS